MEEAVGATSGETVEETSRDGDGDEASELDPVTAPFACRLCQTNVRTRISLMCHAKGTRENIPTGKEKAKKKNEKKHADSPKLTHPPTLCLLARSILPMLGCESMDTSGLASATTASTKNKAVNAEIVNFMMYENLQKNRF